MSEANWLEIDVTIKGKQPGLLCNRFHEDAEASVQRGTSNAIKSTRGGTDREKATKTLYLQGDGRLYIPQENLLASLVEAGRFHKIRKRQVSTKDSSLVTAGLSIETAFLLLETPEGEEIVVDGTHWDVDKRRVRIPATKGSVMRCRGNIPRWQAKLQVLVNTRLFDEDLVRKLFNDSGLMIGLGDFRPQCKGHFGKYDVVRWACRARTALAA